MHFMHTYPCKKDPQKGLGAAYISKTNREPRENKVDGLGRPSAPLLACFGHFWGVFRPENRGFLGSQKGVFFDPFLTKTHKTRTCMFLIILFANIKNKIKNKTCFYKKHIC